MKCLCCGKEIATNASEQALQYQWHQKCIKSFFGSTTFPEINISKDSMERFATESTNKGLTVTGVQKKLSLHLSNENGNARLTLVNYPTGYILKPQTEEYPCLPESEYLIMRLAQLSGIKVVPYALIILDSVNNELAYITKRIDRKNGELLAMEDFCQLDERLTEDKYKGSYERCAKIINRFSSNTGIDMTELFLRLAFCYVVGNSDMHLKNFSLIESGNQQYALSPAYDLLPVNTVNHLDTEQTALTINGKRKNIRYGDFLKFAASAGLSENVAKNLIKTIVERKDLYLSEIKASYLSKELKTNLCSLVIERMEILKNNKYY